MHSKQTVSLRQRASGAKISDPIEVSYTILRVNQENFAEILHQVAVVINLQLTVDGYEIPFVSHTDFDKIKNERRLFLFGASGCGKSRTVFEIIQTRGKEIKNIYIINPRSTGGNESGRRDLATLISSCGDDDLIVWDNFPDGMAKNDPDNVKKALGIACSNNAPRLLLALRPRYLEIYRDIASSRDVICSQEISYTYDKIRNVLNRYGIEIQQFNELYNDYVIKNEEKVAKILWQKEPLPLAILDYFKELRNKKTNLEESWDSEDALMVAQELMYRTEFYDYQFELINNDKNREDDAEFLYSLKLCYELELPRTKSYVTRIQRDIFGSNTPRDPLHTLSAWIYSSGEYYSMHDTPGTAIVFGDVRRKKIMNYLSQNFLNLTENEANSIYLMGNFLGKNIQFVQKTHRKELLKDHVYDLRNSIYFEIGLGHGIGESFDQVDVPSQRKILDRTYGNVLFTRAFGENLGRNFSKFSKGSQKRIFQKIKNSCSFSRGFGIGLGSVFVYLPQEFQNQIFVESEKNVQLADGLGIGLGNVLEYLPKEIQTWIINWAEKNGEFARGLGSGFGQSFTTMSSNLQQLMSDKMAKNTEFARGSGMGIGNAFSQLSKEIQKKILVESEQNLQVSNGLGIGLGAEFSYLPVDYQNAFFNLVERDREFAIGLGLGLSYIFNYLTKEQKNIFKLLSKNIYFDLGTGIGSGLAFLYFSNKQQVALFKKADDDEHFARGLGNGIFYNFGYYTTDFKKVILKKVRVNKSFRIGAGYSLGRTYLFQSINTQRLAMRMANTDSYFALGMGEGFGSRFTYLEKNLKEKIFQKAKTNPDFAEGLGNGIGRNFAYCTKEICEEIFVQARKDQNFADGLGIGLGRCFKYLKVGQQQQLMTMVQDVPELVIKTRVDYKSSDL